MLSQSQFFDDRDYAVHPGKMDFNQFTQNADFFHGTHIPSNFKGDAWDPNLHYEGVATHAGTEKAAMDRTSSHANPGAIIYPLRHVGEYHRDWPRQDASGAYDDEALETGRTIRYKNNVEDPGSISVVAPASSFQTYHQYLDSQPSLTEKQQLERKGRQWNVPTNYKPHDWVPGQRSFDTHAAELARAGVSELTGLPKPSGAFKLDQSWQKSAYGGSLKHPGDAIHFPGNNSAAKHWAAQDAAVTPSHEEVKNFLAGPPIKAKLGKPKKL